MKHFKLRNLIENTDQLGAPPASEKQWDVNAKREALAKIGEYGKYGHHLYREYGLMEIAHNLSEIVKTAEELAIHETNKSAIDEKRAWFDEVTVKKNFQQLSKISEEFNKLAKEASTLEQRMQAAYDDGRHVIERYYEIKDLQEGAQAVSKISKE